MAAIQYKGTGGGIAVSKEPQFITIREYCELDLEGLNTGKRMAEQMDSNPASATYEQKKIVVIAENSDLCPISREPFWKATGNKRCLKNSENLNTGGVEVEEKDVNKLSASYNQTRWTASYDDLNFCPIPENPFIRIIADGLGGKQKPYLIRAKVQDAGGVIYTIESNTDYSMLNYADLRLPRGEYKILECEAIVKDPLCQQVYCSQIYSNNIFVKNYEQYGVENTPTNGQFRIVVEDDFTWNLQANKTIHFVFGNRVAQTYTASRSAAFTRNNCADGLTGSTVTFSKQYTSTISQADAESRADANFATDGQAFANANGTCSTSVFTASRSGDFTRNNCGNGLLGSTVTFSKQYTSTISQSDAEALANANFATDGQAYANVNGVCNSTPKVYISLEPSYSAGVYIVVLSNENGTPYTTLPFNFTFRVTLRYQPYPNSGFETQYNVINTANWQGQLNDIRTDFPLPTELRTENRFNNYRDGNQNSNVTEVQFNEYTVYFNPDVEAGSGEVII